MKKFLFLLVLIPLFIGCEQPNSVVDESNIWDRDNIRFINNATDDEVISIAQTNRTDYMIRQDNSKGIIGHFNLKLEDTSAKSNTDYYFQNTKDKRNCFRYTTFGSLIGGNLPYYEDLKQYFVLRKENDDFRIYYTGINRYSSWVSDIYKYYVSENYICFIQEPYCSNPDTHIEIE